MFTKPYQNSHNTRSNRLTLCNNTYNTNDNNNQVIILSLKLNVLTRIHNIIIQKINEYYHLFITIIIVVKISIGV